MSAAGRFTWRFLPDKYASPATCRRRSKQREEAFLNSSFRKGGTRTKRNLLNAVKWLRGGFAKK